MSRDDNQWTAEEIAEMRNVPCEFLAINRIGNLESAIGYNDQSVAGIPVTDEMITAGKQELGVRQSAPISNDYWAEKIYRAMRALEPKRPIESTSEGYDRLVQMPRRIAEIEAERDAALARADLIHHQWYLAIKQCQELSDDRDAWSAKCADLVTELGRLRGLHEMTVAAGEFRPHGDVFLIGESKETKPDPFREFAGDRRRVGK